jgi:lipopolysaccharide/colanic/teichoic acid biosynthesis glycosyltransferase
MLDSLSGVKQQRANKSWGSMNQLTYLEVVRQSDPTAISPLVKDRVFYHSLKRLVDVCVAVLALLILSPLFIVIAALIVLDTGLPVFFTQNRVGSRRRVRAGFSYRQRTLFPFYKFRTMVKDANPSIHHKFIKALINDDKQGMAAIRGENNQIYKLVGDPRVTRIGKFLRRSSLDELPQFWNILKGDMSLVGPRPPIPYEVEEYNDWHQRRLETKPGLTGLWQVNARSSVDFDEMVRLDIEYIEHQSFWLDIKILIKTIFVVLSGKGAV